MLQVLLPKSLQGQVLHQLHQEHGHQGVKRTVDLVSQLCYWLGMYHNIQQWCQECEKCQLAKDVQIYPNDYMGHLLASRPNQILAVDFTVLEPLCNGLKMFLL